jgi:hypothetical protein
MLGLQMGVNLLGMDSMLTLAAHNNLQLRNLLEDQVFYIDQKQYPERM